MVRKWIDPLDRLLEGDKKAQSVTEFINNSISSKVSDSKDEESPLKELPINEGSETVINVDTKKVIRWKYKNRPENELHNIDVLAEKIKAHGQQEPCIVRLIPDRPGYYELITGERRWNAVIKAGLKLKVIVRNLTDLQASVTQKEENDKDPVSEYANGICYAKQIEDGIIRQSDLINELGLSKQQISRLLSFSKIPQDIIDAIGDMTKVSSGTAEKIKQLASKGAIYKDAIIELSEKIRDGKLGHKRIEKIVLDKVNRSVGEDSKDLTKVYSSDGRHIFTWRLDNNKKPSIHFPNDILKLVSSGRIKIKSLSDKITEIMENEIKQFE